MNSSDAMHADLDPVAGWATSGLSALTGKTTGPPQLGPGDPAGLVTRSLAALVNSTRVRTGRAPALPDARLLGERAAIAGLTRQAPLSCGGAFRAVATTDGHLGLSLARRSDLELLPALVESDLLATRIDTLADGDERAPEWVWESIASWAATLDVTEAVERAALLGLPVAGIPADATDVAPDPTWRDGARVRHTAPRRPRGEVPLVVDLTSLWAGPLCAHLLGLAGCRVVKVESVARPDGARRGPSAFFDLLHSGHEMVALDFASSEGRRHLATLIEQADVVLEGSRPRALQRLGIGAETVVDSGTTWVSITARGRDSDTVGFGDDVAVSAGLLVRHDDGTPAPCGDALADPLTGVVAAAAGAEALAGETAQLLEVSMWHVARASLAAAPETPPHEVHRRADGWWIEHAGGATRIDDPQARKAVQAAGALGADNNRVLQ